MLKHKVRKNSTTEMLQELGSADMWLQGSSQSWDVRASFSSELSRRQMTAQGEWLTYNSSVSTFAFITNSLLWHQFVELNVLGTLGIAKQLA